MPPRKRVAPPPPTLPQAVASGDRRAALEALRDHLAKQLDQGDRDHAALARQLRETLRDLDELPPLQQESALDDLSNRRAARHAKAASQ